MKYQRNYSQHFSSARDVTSRQRKANKILLALTGYLQRDNLNGLTCLDLGCSIGVISNSLSRAGANVIGIDIDHKALTQTPRQSGNATFLVGDAAATPFRNDTFDLIVCSQVYEHAPSLELLVREIHRLLKHDGVCFFAGPNRWALMEEHYRLPFLSWLPKRFADLVVRLAGRGDEYYEHPLSSRHLRIALRNFIIHDLTPQLLQYPEAYSMASQVGNFKYIARALPKCCWSLLGTMVPNFNWILIKADA